MASAEDSMARALKQLQASALHAHLSQWQDEVRQKKLMDTETPNKKNTNINHQWAYTSSKAEPSQLHRISWLDGLQLLQATVWTLAHNLRFFLPRKHWLRLFPDSNEGARPLMVSWSNNPFHCRLPLCLPISACFSISYSCKHPRCP